MLRTKQPTVVLTAVDASFSSLSPSGFELSFRKYAMYRIQMRSQRQDTLKNKECSNRYATIKN